MKHTGLHSYRLKESAGNPREVAFSKQWQEDNDFSKTLEHLLGDGTGRNNPRPTQREAEVAATVIQWLGSPVGMCFLMSVLKKPEFKDWVIKQSK